VLIVLTAQGVNRVLTR